MARLLASTPLIKAGLPPLCIPTTLKSKYVAALDHVRDLFQRNVLSLIMTSVI